MIRGWTLLVTAACVPDARTHVDVPLRYIPAATEPDRWRLDVGEVRLADLVLTGDGRILGSWPELEVVEVADAEGLGDLTLLDGEITSAAFLLEGEDGPPLVWVGSWTVLGRPVPVDLRLDEPLEVSGIPLRLVVDDDAPPIAVSWTLDVTAVLSALPVDVGGPGGARPLTTDDPEVATALRAALSSGTAWRWTSTAADGAADTGG